MDLDLAEQLSTDALQLVAKKLQSSRTVDGEPTGDGLSACGADRDVELGLPPGQNWKHKLSRLSWREVSSK